VTGERGRGEGEGGRRRQERKKSDRERRRRQRSWEGWNLWQWRGSRRTRVIYKENSRASLERGS